MTNATRCTLAIILALSAAAAVMLWMDARRPEVAKAPEPFLSDETPYNLGFMVQFICMTGEKSPRIQEQACRVSGMSSRDSLDWLKEHQLGKTEAPK